MRYITAGESHGPQLTTIIEGVPAGLPLVADDINEELARRQKGYGRGRRMQIETDQVQIVSGVRHGETLGSPIALVVENRDFAHWTKIMGAEPLTEQEEKEMKRKVTKPRPGHADLNGAIKYGHSYTYLLFVRFHLYKLLKWYAIAPDAPLEFQYSLYIQET